MRVHREIKREIGCLTLRAMFDIGCALRAFRVGLAEGLAGRYLFSGKHLWHLKQPATLDQWMTRLSKQVSCRSQQCSGFAHNPHSRRYFLGRILFLPLSFFDGTENNYRANADSFCKCIKPSENCYYLDISGMIAMGAFYGCGIATLNPKMRSFAVDITVCRQNRSLRSASEVG
jgi:hypothetical protein